MRANKSPNRKSRNLQSKRGQALNTRYQGQVLDAKRQGQAYVEFILVMPIFLIFIAAIIGYGQILYTRLAVDAAAWSSTRHAIASLDETRATNQAFLAARYTLSGFGLNPNSAHVYVTHWGEWQRGTQVRVEVCYDVPSPPVPMGDVLSPGEVCARQIMPVNQLKSKW